jgi:hypothetical protein
MSLRTSAVTGAAALALLAAPAAAQVRVDPTGVNVNAHGATTVFLTFGGLGDYVPAEATWCGELVPAAPDIGFRCDPATVFGRLPARFDRSRPSGVGGFTDIMSIPPSVARRAYQAAEDGATSSFFYVRRFVSTGGGPDQYVAVTCRMTGGGARTPLSLTDVRVAFEAEPAVLHLAPGSTAPPLSATITYTGTGRLRGRWEVVLPGEDPPAPNDLLTEATLPLEARGTQRRYTELSRFNLFLPPTGSVVVPGPDPARLPTTVHGVYLVLLRIEASDDKEGNSNLEAAGAGTGIVASGAVAGFPMPVLRYVIGGGDAPADAETGELTLLHPTDTLALDGGAPVFSWRELPEAAYYRLDVESPGGEALLSAVLPRGTAGYRPPPWFTERVTMESLRWRVVAADPDGREIARSRWHTLEVRRP